MTTHSSILAWKIPWTEEPSGLQPIGLQRVRPNRMTNRHTDFTNYLLRHISVTHQPCDIQQVTLPLFPHLSRGDGSVVVKMKAGTCVTGLPSIRLAHSKPPIKGIFRDGLNIALRKYHFASQTSEPIFKT